MEAPLSSAAALALLATATAPMLAQNGHRDRGSSLPAAIAVRAAPSAPHIDGSLDDPAWGAALVVSDFTQRDPHEGEPPTEPTEFRVVYTDAAIFVGVRAYDSQPDEVRGLLTRRDIQSPSDWIGIGFDSYFDRRTAFGFFLNPAGVKRDAYFFNDSDRDDSWDAVWEGAASRDSIGWTAEFRIPFSQLRFPKAERHTFGLQVYRSINRLAEEQFWRLPPKDQAGFVSMFGDLEGIEGIEPPRRMEVMPYVAGAGLREPEEDGNPFRTGRHETARLGADLNVGVTSNLTLNATINPDFGQVEADPAVVNLSAFETFYPEKRPFFLEGLDVFRFPILLGDGDGANEQLFYSRRIGRRPQGEADDRGGYAETVQETTILGAAKLSGKTPGGWTVGLLTALTAEEKSDVVDSDGNLLRDVVEPRSGYFVGRLARDYRNGLTQVGLFGTAVARQLPDNLDYLHSQAYALGLRWGHRFRNDTYSFSGWVSGSHVRGSAEALERTQRSSARYYQRPDNDHVTLDPTRTSLSGFASQMSFGKHAGGSWRWSTGFDTRSPGYEVNDAGYQRESDRTIQYVWVGYRKLQPGNFLRRANLNFNAWGLWNYGWDRMATGGNVNGSFTLLNYWGGHAGMGYEHDGLSVGSLRGGPAIVYPANLDAWGGIRSDDRKQLSGGIGGHGQLRDESGSWNYGGYLDLQWRPTGYLDLSVSPGVFRQFDSWQYVKQQEALGSDHYIFGELKQTTVNTTLRVSSTFTPNLSLQVYAQPFLSTGDYIGFKEVADPKAAQFSDRFRDFGPDHLILDAEDVAVDLDADGSPEIDVGEPDFTYISFRSTTVLRWEYRPGSTLFLVWQHGREDYNHDGAFKFGSNLDHMFRIRPKNTFVLKLNYWLSL